MVDLKLSYINEIEMNRQKIYTEHVFTARRGRILFLIDHLLWGYGKNLFILGLL